MALVVRFGFTAMVLAAADGFRGGSAWVSTRGGAVGGGGGGGGGSEAAAGDPPQHYKFPDGSEYYGQTRDGKLEGQGAWRSADGTVYKGSFVADAFEGQGVYTTAAGNTYAGGFKAGAFDGAGTYLHADGRAEVGTYAAGADRGVGARWSSDRNQAWRMLDGEVSVEIPLEEAAAIAASVGLSVPKGLFELSDAAMARLEAKLAGGGDGGRGGGDFESHVETPSMDGSELAGLVAHSKGPIVSAEACEAVIREAEERAEKMGGWTTERHANYPTTDVPVQKLPRCFNWVKESLLPEVAFPFLSSAFGLYMPKHSSSSGKVDPRLAFRVVDAFVVKYDAAAGQRELKPHRDGSVFSFNVALNSAEDYEGGGTYFRRLESEGGGDVGDGSLRSDRGHILAHSSALMHGGHPISSGVRYILVAFVTMESQHLGWAHRFYEHVREQDEENSESE